MDGPTAGGPEKPEGSFFVCQGALARGDRGSSRAPPGSQELVAARSASASSDKAGAIGGSDSRIIGAGATGSGGRTGCGGGGGGASARGFGGAISSGGRRLLT